MKHPVPTLASALFLTGCAGMAGLLGAHVNAYEGKERPIEDVAVLFSPGNAMLARVDGRHVGDKHLGYPSDVRVLPGERTLRVDCMGAAFREWPTEFRGRFEAGHFYNLYCHDQGKDRYVVDMKDLGTRDPRKP